MASVREGVPVEAARDEIIRVMRVQRKLKANQDNDFAVTSSDAALEFISRITAPIAWCFPPSRRSRFWSAASAS